MQNNWTLDAAGTPPKRCRCARLSQLLTCEDNHLFNELDHVCDDVMRDSCCWWRKEAESTGERGCCALGGNGFYTDRLVPGESDWPVKLRGSKRRLVMVLRQWVEERPDLEENRLAALLESEREWHSLVAELSFLRERGCLHPSPDRSAAIGIMAQLHLRERGLPGTPGTIRYALYRAGFEFPGEPAPWPTRGLRVTSFVVADEGQYVPVGVPNRGHNEDILFDVSGSSVWSTAALRRQADSVVEQHRAWWARISKPNLPAADLRCRNRRVADDELGELIADHCRGERPIEDLVTAALQQAQKRQGRALTTPDKKRITRNIKARITRRQRRLEHPTGQREDAVKIEEIPTFNDVLRATTKLILIAGRCFSRDHDDG
jgi:hypothetical protein